MSRKAHAEIWIDPTTGWTLPTFGSKEPFRYWAHVHFENDPTWPERTWTLLVHLDKAPEAQTEQVAATVYFMSPEAPEELLTEGAKFELMCGQSYYGKGTITRVLAV